MEAGSESLADADPRFAPGAAPGRALPWRPIALAGLAAAAYRELLWIEPERSLPAELERFFFVPSESLAPVVVVICLWLLFRRRSVLRALPARPGSGWVGAGLLGASAGAYLWSLATAAPDLLVPSLALFGLGCAWLWKGAAASRAVALPTAVLFFAMPLPAPALNQLIYPLQLGTTQLAAGLLYLMGISHVVLGEQILRPHYSFSVIESCAGLRSMETLTLLAILMVDLFRRRGLHAWLVVGAAPVVSFAMNGVRALVLILNPHSEIAAIHNLQGVAILLAGLVILFAWDGLLERLPLPGRGRAGAPGAEGPAGPGVPGRPLPVLLALLLVTLTLASWLWPRWQPQPHLPASLVRRIADPIGVSRPVELDRTFLGTASFREAALRRFALTLGEVDLFVGVGSRAVRGASPVSPKVGLPGSGWVVEQEGQVLLPAGGTEATVRVIRSGGRRLLSYHWYLGAAPWPMEALRAALALDRSPLREPGEILAVRVTVPISGSPGEGRERADSEILRLLYVIGPLLDRLARDLEG